MWIGWLEFDILLGDVRSLKEKRSVVRPLVAELQRRFSVSVAETGSLDLHRRAGIGMAVVAADSAHVIEVLDAAAPYGISKALNEVLSRARAHLEANERSEASRHVRLLIERSGLTEREFASRIGVAAADLAAFLAASISPSASLMIRMRRLSDRFAKIRAQDSEPAVADPDGE